MAEIRNATVDDIPVLMSMGRALHAESPRYSYLSYSDEKVERLIRSMVEDTLVAEAPGGVVVAVKDGIVVGMIGGFVTSPFFSDDKIASDYTFYVKPEHRGTGRVALRLIQAFEQWAIAQGVRDIVPGTSTLIDAEGTAALYRHLGYEMHGYIFKKRVS